MRKLLYTVVLSCSSMLLLPQMVKAYTGSEDVSCKSINCADMGYSSQSIANCAEYISCPFDTSYRACVKYNDEYTLTSCPTGAVCEGKYKVTSCTTGYTLNNGTCECSATLTSCPTGYNCTSCKKGTTTYYAKNGCATGYEVSRQPLGNCYKSSCALSTTPTGANTALLLSGKVVVTSCQTGYQTLYTSDQCITCKKIDTCPTFIACPVGATCSTGTGGYTISSCRSGYTATFGLSGCIEKCTLSSSSTCMTQQEACSRCSGGTIQPDNLAGAGCYTCCVESGSSGLMRCLSCLI